MLSEWDRDKLRQALGPETGEKVADLLDTIGSPAPMEFVPTSDTIETSSDEEASDDDTSSDE